MVSPWRSCCGSPGSLAMVTLWQVGRPNKGQACSQEKMTSIGFNILRISLVHAGLRYLACRELPRGGLSQDRVGVEYSNGKQAATRNHIRTRY
jgi:hypothetical protein